MKKNRVFTAGMLAIVLALGSVVMGCASTPAKSGFADGKRPLTIVSTVNESSAKTASLTTKVWLGLFGTTTFPSIADVAKEGGIQEIATVEYYVRPGILYLWKEYTTIVTGD
jgi:hypothetical protein